MDRAYLLLINAIAYTLTFIYFIKKRNLSVGHIIWGLFTLSSWGSFLLIRQPLFAGSLHDNPMTIWPFIYLYLVLLIFFLPLFKLDKLTFFKNGIEIPNFKIWKYVMIACISWQILSFIINLPDITQITNTNTAELAEYRDVVYESSNSAITKNPILNRFNLVFSGLRSICFAMSIFLMLCYKKHRKIVTIFFITSIIDIIAYIVLMVSRGLMVCYTIYAVSLLVFLREYLTSRIKRMMIVYGIPFIVIAFSAFWAISVSRFGELANFMIFKYLGEPMVNFNGLLFDKLQGYTWGRAYFSTIYRYCFGEINFISAIEKWDFIEKITGVRAQYFFTFVGGLMFEFGKTGTILIAIIMNKILKNISLHNNPYCFNCSFIWFLFIYIYSYGIFVVNFQGFDGNLMILYSVLFYFIFKKNIKPQRIYNPIIQ